MNDTKKTKDTPLGQNGVSSVEVTASAINLTVPTMAIVNVIPDIKAERAAVRATIMQQIALVSARSERAHDTELPGLSKTLCDLALAHHTISTHS